MVSGYELMAIAFALAMDAFAVSIAISVRLVNVTKRQIFRLTWHFGLFQAMMPVIGWYCGMTIEPIIKAWDHWVAFLLLFLIGAKSIKESFSQDNDDEEAMDPTRGYSLVLLSVATSIDALAIGLSFASLGVRVWRPSLVIGLVASAMTYLGIVFGAALGQRFGKRMELVGGLVLVVIGFKILLSHTFFA